MNLYLAAISGVAWILAVLAIMLISPIRSHGSKWNVLQWPGGVAGFTLSYLAIREPMFAAWYRASIELILFATGFTLLYVPGLIVKLTTGKQVSTRLTSAVSILLRLEGGAITGLAFGSVIAGGSTLSLYSGTLLILLLPLVGVAIGGLGIVVGGLLPFRDGAHNPTMADGER